MKKLITKQNQGFTLIELLVVIAVIGILAVIVLGALNPLEQINRANDATAKNNVNTVGNAAQTFFTASGSIYSNGPSYPAIQADMAPTDLKAAITGVSYCGN